MRALALTVLAVFSGGPIAPSAAAQTFRVLERMLQAPVHGAPQALDLLGTGRPALMVMTKRRGVRLIQLYDLSEGDLQPAASLPVPADMIYYDIGENPPALYYLTPQGILRETGKGPALVARTPSLWPIGANPDFDRLGFVRDADGDGLDDLLVPDFAASHLFVQAADGRFSPAGSIQVPARAVEGFSGLSYRSYPVEGTDADGDGRQDLLFRIDRDYLVSRQGADGRFEAVPVPLPIAVPIAGNSWAESDKADEAATDQTDYRFTGLAFAEDVTGDGLLDLITETDRAQGVFNRRTLYALHPGRRDQGWLSFDAAPAGELVVEGLGAEARLFELGDGRRALGIGGVKLGLRRVVGALLTGKTELQIALHGIGADGFSAPLITQELAIDFDLSRGNASTPLVAMGDFSGNGHRDLIVSEGETELRLYLQTPDGFARRAEKLAVPVPNNGQRLVVADFTGDGRDDLVLAFDRLGADGPEAVRRVILLLSQDEAS